MDAASDPASANERRAERSAFSLTWKKWKKREKGKGKEKGEEEGKEKDMEDEKGKEESGAKSSEEGVKRWIFDYPIFADLGFRLDYIHRVTLDRF